MQRRLTEREMEIYGHATNVYNITKYIQCKDVSLQGSAFRDNHHCDKQTRSYLSYNIADI